MRYKICEIIGHKLQKGPIELRLYVISGGGWLGPVQCTVFYWQEPDLLLKEVMDKALELPHTMRTSKPRRLYSRRNRSFLVEERTFGQQKIKTGDIVVLTDIDDISELEAILKVIPLPEEKEGKSRSRAKIVAKGFIQGIPWIGPGIAALLFGEDC